MEENKGFTLKGITRIYRGKEVLSGVSCRLTPDRRWGILGASGSGKSTLLRLIAGLEPPDAGEIHLDGQLLSTGGRIRIPARQRRISMVFQDLALWPNLTVMENITLGPGSGKSGRERAMKSLSICGISKLAHRYPAELSGGEQQRLALARALATRPEYLFLDEPFSGLDLEIKNTVIHKIRQLTRKHGITTVLVSHDPFEVFNMCRMVIVMDSGQILETGSFNKLLKNPESPLIRAFRDYMSTINHSESDMSSEEGQKQPSAHNILYGRNKNRK